MPKGKMGSGCFPFLFMNEFKIHPCSQPSKVMVESTFEPSGPSGKCFGIVRILIVFFPRTQRSDPSQGLNPDYLA